MRKAFSYFALLALLFGAVSCVEEQMNNEENGSKAGAGEVSFVIGGDSALTKAADSAPVMEPIDFSEETGIEGLELVETVSSLDEDFYPLDTKGTPVYTENFDANYGTDLWISDYDISSGNLVAFQGNDPFQFGKTAANTYSYTYEKGVHWPSDGQLLYFLQAPGSVTKALNNGEGNEKFYKDGHIEFDYTVPAKAEDQKDILFTSKLMKEATKDTENHILMYHALTAVKFKVNFASADLSATVKSVTIKDLVSSGHCTITPNYVDGVNTSDGNQSNKKNDSNSATKSSACSLWKLGTSTASYTVVPAGIVSADKSKASGVNKFADSFYDSTKSYTDNLNDSNFTQTLMLVPQKKEKVEVVIVLEITKGGVTSECTRTAYMNIDWKAGEIHTYQFTIDKVDVKVDDTVNTEKTEKSSVTTTNTGSATAYLRASYAIAWYYGYGENAIAVAPYGGKGTFSGLPGTDWIEGDDGYYYYKNPVKPGNATNSALFTKFTAPTEAQEAPFPHAHLEVTMLLQGVRFDKEKVDVTKAWGDVKVKGLSNTVVSQLSTTPEEKN